MRIAIALPSALEGAALAAWAQRAEAAGLPTLVALDGPGHEPLVALTAAAAVTERIELMAALVQRPERSTRLLTRQAAALRALSGERLTIVLEAASTPADYAGAPGPPTLDPGHGLAMQLAALRAIEGGGPSVLLDGAAVEQAARHADGWTLRHGAPHQFADGAHRLHAAWVRHERAGAPRVVGFFAADPEDPDAVRDMAAAFELAGATDLVALPTRFGPEQPELLAIALSPALAA